MSTKSRQSKPKASFRYGVDITTPLSSPEIAETLSECLNGEMVNNDIIRTRNGYSGVTATKTNYIVREGIDYVKSDGSRESIVYLESTTITGSSGILGRVNGTTIDTITSGLPDGIKPCLIQARSTLFIFTGISDLIYDGVATRQIGIDFPAVIPSIHSNITGALNTNGSYVFVYTYYNTVTGAESSPSLPSVTLDAGANGGIKIQVTAGNSTTADQIKIYRSVSGGNVFFLDGTALITDTTYSSTISDAALGNELELDNSRLPEPAKFATLLDNRLFVGGFASNPNRIQYSKVGLVGAMFESFQAADFTDCDPNDGDKIVGIGKMGSKVGIIKQRKAGKLLPMDLPLGGLERSGYQKYIHRSLPAPCTATNHHSIFQLSDRMGWMGKDNIYISDGIDVVPIANRISTSVRSLNHNLSYKYSSIVLESSQQVLISVVRLGQSEPDYQFIGHYSNYPVIGWTMFSPGVDPVTHPGLPIASIWPTLLNGNTEYYLGTSNSNGKVCQYSSGTNDDGNAIYFSVKAQWDIGNDAVSKKSFHSINYLATANAPSTTNTLTNTWEEDGKEYVVKSLESTIPVSTKWATAKWASFKWAGLVYTMIKFFPNRKAYLGRFGFYNSDINSQFAIKTMRLMYRLIQE